MSPSLVFMGTPDFAVPPLVALHQKGFHIPLVITQPDRPQGRGQKMVETPVKKMAQELGLPILQPLKINETDVVSQITALNPDFFVVVAFGQFLSKTLLAIPTRGSINIHASLLPSYRGASPIHRAIINGEKQTGVTTMMMDQGMDSGDTLLTVKTDILDTDTAESLHDRLSSMGADLITETLDGILSDRIVPQSQNHSLATFAPMLNKKDGQLPWTRSAWELDCFVRGMTPWPGAFTFFSGKRLKIFTVKPLDLSSDSLPGTVIESTQGHLIIQTGQGALSILEIQGASGKRMPIADFLRGFPIAVGDMFQ